MAFTYLGFSNIFERIVGFPIYPFMDRLSGGEIVVNYFLMGVLMLGHLYFVHNILNEIISPTKEIYE